MWLVNQVKNPSPEVLQGWVLNEGGRLVIEYLKRDKPWKSWNLRIFILGLNFQIGWKF